MFRLISNKTSKVRNCWYLWEGSRGNSKHTNPDCTKTLGSTSIRHRSDTCASGRCLIHVDPMTIVIWESINLPTMEHRNVGTYSLSDKTSCWPISLNMEAVRYMYNFRVVRSFLHLWKMIRRRLSNFRTKRSLKHPNLRLRDLGSSYCLVNRSHVQRFDLKRRLYEIDIARPDRCVECILDKIMSRLWNDITLIWQMPPI